MGAALALAETLLKMDKAPAFGHDPLVANMISGYLRNLKLSTDIYWLIGIAPISPISPRKTSSHPNCLVYHQSTKVHALEAKPLVGKFLAMELMRRSVSHGLSLYPKDWMKNLHETPGVIGNTITVDCLQSLQ